MKGLILTFVAIFISATALADMHNGGGQRPPNQGGGNHGGPVYGPRPVPRPMPRPPVYLPVPVPVPAPGYYPGYGVRTVVCGSPVGGVNYCFTGLSQIQRIIIIGSNGYCQYGYSLGYQGGNIMVSDGCSGQFQVEGY